MAAISARAAFLCVLLLCVAADGQEKPWNWAQPAEHHKAVVHVDSGEGSGTGTLIYATADGAQGLVLTAAHVVTGQSIATARWRGEYAPYESSGRISARSPEA